MGRLHVILRRESGRVTDIEYMHMRHDAPYCRHVLELAEQINNDALPEICARLKEVFFGEGGSFMVMEPKPLLAPRNAPETPVAKAIQPSTPAIAGTANEGHEQAYIGRLR